MLRFFLNFFGKDQRKLRRILGKITAYQRSLCEDRPVELDELRNKGVLSSSDIEFMSAKEVKYKPHRVSDYHAMDMLHMPTESGCVFIGPSSPAPSKRTAQLVDFQTIVLNFLKIPRPKDELLLHVEFAKRDGMGISPGFISFNLRSKQWRERLPSLRSVAAELGFSPFQDNEVQGSHALTFQFSADIDQTAQAVIGLLSRGCGFPNNAEITYSAGALDEA